MSDQKGAEYLPFFSLCGPKESLLATDRALSSIQVAEDSIGSLLVISWREVSLRGIVIAMGRNEPLVAKVGTSEESNAVPETSWLPRLLERTRLE